jgi:hypothetical protein
MSGDVIYGSEEGDDKANAAGTYRVKIITPIRFGQTPEDPPYLRYESS